MVSTLCARQPCRLLNPISSRHGQHRQPRAAALVVAGLGAAPLTPPQRQQHMRRSCPAVPLRHIACAAWFNQGKGPEERIAEVVQPRQGDELLESLQLKREVRDRVSDAVEDLGGKVHCKSFSFQGIGKPFTASESRSHIDTDSPCLQYGVLAGRGSYC